LCNAGPLISLAKLNRLALLGQLYPNLAIPKTVYREAITEGLALGAADAVVTRLFVERYALPIIEASQEVMDSYRPAILLDAGELELLALARDQPGTLVLIDDEVARAEARRIGLSVKGTLGVLVAARRAAEADRQLPRAAFPAGQWRCLSRTARSNAWL